VIRPLHDQINVTETYTLRTHMRWRTVISHLKAASAKRIIKVVPDITVRYIFDFYGLLQHLEIPEYYHYPILLVNDFYTPTQYDGNLLEIRMIDIQLLEHYKTLFISNP